MNDGERIVVWHDGAVDRATRASLTGGPGAVVWFTGLSGSGKSTVAVELERRLVAEGRAAYLLDGDNLRHGLNADLGFSAADRDENVRRVGEVAALFADADGVVVETLAEPGQVVSAGQIVVRVAHAGRREAVIELPETLRPATGSTE